MDPLRDTIIKGPEFGKTYEVWAIEQNPLKPWQTQLFFPDFEHGFDAERFVATEAAGMGILRDICRDPHTVAASFEEPKIGVNRSYSASDRRRMRDAGVEPRRSRTPERQAPPSRCRPED